MSEDNLFYTEETTWETQKKASVNTIRDLKKNRVRIFQLDSAGSELDPVADSCEHGN
jgi:hypothetical protein